jgi:outer membrane protein assembly factor BamA
MPRIRALFIAATLLIAVAAPVRGQSLVLRSIHFEGAPGYSDAELMKAAGLKEGQGYSSDELNQHAKLLIDSGIFQTVDYKFDGSKLNYSLNLNQESYPIVFGNLPLEPGQALDARLHDRVPLYHGRVPAEGTLLEGVRKALEETLAGEGIHAHVIAAPVTDETTHNVTAVKFSIDAPMVRIGNVKFEGVSDGIKQQLQDIAVRAASPYDAEKSPEELERRITAVYVVHGFAAVEVRVFRAGKPVIADGVIRVPFTIAVKEGRSYRLGTVEISPDIPIAKAEIDRLLAVRASTIPENKFIGDLVSSVESRLKAKGYLDCKVTPEPQVDDTAGVVNYVVSADLGTAYHLAYVKPAGASR